MKHAKLVSKPLTPLIGYFKLDKKSCSVAQEEKNDMTIVPYSLGVGSLMYVMVCAWSDIAHAIGVVSRYLSNLGCEHWARIKWILRYLRGSFKMCACFGNSKLILES